MAHIFYANFCVEMCNQSRWEWLQHSIDCNCFGMFSEGAKCRKHDPCMWSAQASGREARKRLSAFHTTNYYLTGSSNNVTKVSEIPWHLHPYSKFDTLDALFSRVSKPHVLLKISKAIALSTAIAAGCRNNKLSAVIRCYLLWSRQMKMIGRHST